MSAAPQSRWSRLLWSAVRLAHRFDFAIVLPALARLPIGLGHRLAAWRGALNAMTGRDWRSVALGFRHIRAQTALGYRQLPLHPTDAQVRRWLRERFVVEARDEYEARLVAGGRVPELACDVRPAGALGQLVNRDRGLVLLTPHFESFVLGLTFLARSGAKVSVMSSAVTHDPRVDPAVQRHFTLKYRGLENFLNGGKVVDLELGTRQFYRMLQDRQVLVILGDGPALPNGASMEVDFLGARRVLSGGALRMAQRTHSDLGAYICRHVEGKRYELELGPIGRAEDPSALTAAYRFLSEAILKHPGGWWAADLLPSMPVVEQAPASIAATPAPAAKPSDHDTLVLTDSPLAGSEELACGLQQLRRHLRGKADPLWHEASAAQAPAKEFVQRCSAPYLLVLLQPALLATQSLPAELQAALAAADADCAVAADQRGASGEWAIGYTTQVDFERYVARRQALPPSASWDGATPWAYMVRLASARELLQRDPGLGWHELPRAFAGRTVTAPRAFVHSYADYQQGAREEMLELLPATVRRLLDVGGGEGRFARTFIEQRGGEAWLVEPSAAAEKAQPHDRLRVFHGTLEQLDSQQAGLFDAVSFLDVLEHLEQPLQALRDARRLLRPGGLLLASVPNAGHWSVVRDLALGRFDYGPVGILCTTHLRFFTQRSLEQMLAEAGFEVLRWRHAGPPMPEEFQRFIAAGAQAQLAWDTESLKTESLHVLAALR